MFFHLEKVPLLFKSRWDGANAWSSSSWVNTHTPQIKKEKEREAFLTPPPLGKYVAEGNFIRTLGLFSVLILQLYFFFQILLGDPSFPRSPRSLETISTLVAVNLALHLQESCQAGLLGLLPFTLLLGACQWEVSSSAFQRDWMECIVPTTKHILTGQGGWLLPNLCPDHLFSKT